MEQSLSVSNNSSRKSCHAQTPTKTLCIETLDYTHQSSLNKVDTTQFYANNTTINITQSTPTFLDRTLMAQRPGEKLVEDRSLLVVQDESDWDPVDSDSSDGELLDSTDDEDAKPDENATTRSKLKVTGTTRDTLFVENTTTVKVENIIRDSMARHQCVVGKCAYTPSSRDWLQVHTEQHFIIYACRCGFASSTRHVVSRHIREVHQDKRKIVQADKHNYQQLRRLVPDLPLICPRLPLSTKPMVATRCVPPAKRLAPPPPAPVKRSAPPPPALPSAICPVRSYGK